MISLPLLWIVVACVLGQGFLNVWTLRRLKAADRRLHDLTDGLCPPVESVLETLGLYREPSPGRLPVPVARLRHSQPVESGTARPAPLATASALHGLTTINTEILVAVDDLRRADDPGSYMVARTKLNGLIDRVREDRS